MASSTDRQHWCTVIVYNLTCTQQHRFEGWFASAEDFARQTESKLLTCPMCGDASVSRLPNASYVSTGVAERATEPKQEKDSPKQGNKHYANLAAELLANFVDKVIESTEDVGSAFPEEARKIHYNEAPERHIRGTASLKEVAALRDEGIEVAPIPVPLHRLNKTH